MSYEELCGKDIGSLHSIFIQEQRAVENFLDEENVNHNVRAVPEFFLSLGEKFVEEGTESGDPEVKKGLCIAAAVLGKFTFETVDRNDFLTLYEQLNQFEEKKVPDIEPFLNPKALSNTLDKNVEEALNDAGEFWKKERKSLPEDGINNTLAIHFMESAEVMLELVEHCDSPKTAIALCYASESTMINVEMTYKKGMKRYYELL